MSKCRFTWLFAENIQCSLAVPESKIFFHPWKLLGNIFTNFQKFWNFQEMLSPFSLELTLLVLVWSNFAFFFLQDRGFGPFVRFLFRLMTSGWSNSLAFNLSNVPLSWSVGSVRAVCTFLRNKLIFLKLPWLFHSTYFCHLGHGNLPEARGMGRVASSGSRGGILPRAASSKGAPKTTKVFKIP